MKKLVLYDTNVILDVLLQRLNENNEFKPKIKSVESANPMSSIFEQD